MYAFLRVGKTLPFKIFKAQYSTNMERQEAKSRLESGLQSAVKDNSELHSAFLLIYSDSRDLHWNLATGQTEGIEADPEQPFYAASIGKTFTSTILLCSPTTDN